MKKQSDRMQSYWKEREDAVEKKWNECNLLFHAILWTVSIESKYELRIDIFWTDGQHSAAACFHKRTYSKLVYFKDDPKFVKLETSEK